MTTYENLTAAIRSIQELANVPCFYASTSKRSDPPYIVYLGAGQKTYQADNTHYWRQNQYQIEYYYTEKNEEIEAAIEDALLDRGFLYTKGEDISIDGEDVFVIYYYI